MQTKILLVLKLDKLSIKLIKFNSIPITFIEVLSFENILPLRGRRWNINDKYMNENKHTHKYMCVM